MARTKDGLIVALEQPRGLDIPGGHLETILDPENRQTREQPEEALVRECLEEASMYITNIRHFVTIHTDQGYMLSFLAEVESLETFDASKTNGEVLSRRLMTPVDFLAKTQDTPLVHEIVRRANILWCDPNTGTLQFPDQSFTIDPSNEGSRA